MLLFTVWYITKKTNNYEYHKNIKKIYSLLFGYILLLLYRFHSPLIDIIILRYLLCMFRLWNFIQLPN